MEVKIDTTFIDRMGPMTEAIKRAVQRGIEDGARLMESGAKKRVQRGSKTGEIYEKYNPRRTHTASAPGESPATDTGFLASNITIESKELEAWIIAKAKYSAWLEFGTSKIKPRPFMFPAYEENKRNVQKMVEVHVRGVTG
jgi:HK97 gp10 family phage protein